MSGRENASAALLNYGFTFYDTKLVVKGGSVLGTERVWKAADPTVDVGIKDDLYVTVPRGQANDLKTAVGFAAAADCTGDVGLRGGYAARHRGYR